MQLSLSQLEVLKPTNWSPKCRRNTIIGLISMVALGAIVFLSSSQARAWLRFQFMTESLACKKLKTAIENNDPVAAKAILKMFSNSEKIKEYLKSAINKGGDTVLHRAMHLMSRSDEWKEVAKALLAKPYAAELLQVKNDQGKNPWFLFRYDPKPILWMTQMTELSAEVWKTPIDEDGGTVLHSTMFLMGSSVEWKEVAEALLAKPYAAELLRVKDNQEESPWVYVRHNPKAILWMTQMPELPEEVWEIPIDEDGNTVLHQAMPLMDIRDGWKEVAEALLAKPYAAELLQVKNNREESPWYNLKYNIEGFLFLAKMPELSEEVWKIPIDEDGDTVLHQAMLWMDSSDEWKKVAEVLLAKPYALELLQVKNNQGKNPWFYVKYDREAILFLAKMPELPEEAWKIPIDEDGNTVLHLAILMKNSLGDWKEVAEALLAKPFADELKQVKNNAGDVPSDIGN